jgi:hypothetical protein
MRWHLAAFLIALPLATPLAHAAEPVDVALVLVTDVSRSIDDSEFQLEKKGYASAFDNPEVIAAISGGPVGAIGVAYVEFASSNQITTVLDWTVIHGATDAHAFSARMLVAPRSAWGRTAIGEGIERGMQLLASSNLEAGRRIIDVCGDGTSNAGIDVTVARDQAIAAGITVNGLTIINLHPVSWIFAHVQPPGGLTKWYEDHVVGGTGSFVLEVHDFQSFGTAMTRKLINEIAARETPGEHGSF